MEFATVLSNRTAESPINQVGGMLLQVQGLIRTREIPKRIMTYETFLQNVGEIEALSASVSRSKSASADIAKTEFEIGRLECLIEMGEAVAHHAAGFRCEIWRRRLVQAREMLRTMEEIQ